MLPQLACSLSFFHHRKIPPCWGTIFFKRAQTMTRPETGGPSGFDIGCGVKTLSPCDPGTCTASKANCPEAESERERERERERESEREREREQLKSRRGLTVECVNC